MMRIPEYLEVAQWALLFALGALVVVLYRQLGRLLSHERDPAAPGPAVGDGPRRSAIADCRMATLANFARPWPARADRLRRSHLPGLRAAGEQSRHPGSGRRTGGHQRPAAHLRPAWLPAPSPRRSRTPCWRLADRWPRRRWPDTGLRHAVAGGGRRHRGDPGCRGGEHVQEVQVQAASIARESEAAV